VAEQGKALEKMCGEMVMTAAALVMSKGRMSKVKGKALGWTWEPGQGPGQDQVLAQGWSVQRQLLQELHCQLQVILEMIQGKIQVLRVAESQGMVIQGMVLQGMVMAQLQGVVVAINPQGREGLSQDLEQGQRQNLRQGYQLCLILRQDQKQSVVQQPVEMVQRQMKGREWVKMKKLAMALGGTVSQRLGEGQTVLGY